MNSTLRLNRFDRNAIFGLIVVMLLFATPLVWQQIGASEDYGWRIRQAYEMTERDIYASLIRLLQTILPFVGFVFGTVIVATSFYIATTFVVYRTLAAELSYRTPCQALGLLTLTLSCVVLQPISLSPLISTRDMVLNWINLSPHYNPTTLALRPIVLPLTLIAILAFTSHSVFSWKQILSVMIMVIFSSLIKPNWLIAFLPLYSLVVFAAWLWQVKFDRPMVLIGFGLSSVIALVFTFGVGTPASKTILLVKFFTYDLNPTVMIKILLSIAFPLFVTFAWHKESRKDWTLLFTWVMLLVAVIQGLVFDEGGARATHHNFLWGQSITGWILFILGVRLYVRQTSELWQTAIPTRWTWRIATLLLTLHTITGVLWWIAHYGKKVILFP